MFNKFIHGLNRKINPAGLVQVFVLGHQKSGTTVISALLGHISGLKCGEIEPLYGMGMGFGDVADSLMKQPKKLSYLCHRYPNLFGYSMLKDADAIFIFPEIKRVFNRARFVFIVRDPRDTIRSVCNRLGLPGDSSAGMMTPENMTKPTRHWELILSSRLPLQSGIDPDFSHYVANLAHRWKAAANLFRNNSENMVLIRYEDFLADKVQSISNLAKSLDLTCEASIVGLVDKQYQPKGNTNVDVCDFFGDKNLDLIETICASEMKYFSYSKVG